MQPIQKPFQSVLKPLAMAMTLMFTQPALAGESVDSGTASNTVSSNIVETAVAVSGGELDNDPTDFDILINALVTTGLDSALTNNEAQFTVFAPTDAAFITLAQELGYAGDDEAGALEAIVHFLTSLSEAGDPIGPLTEILLYHVSSGQLTSADLGSIEQVMTLAPSGDTFSPLGTRLSDQFPPLDDPNLITDLIDIETSNGLIHAIDRVLLPSAVPFDQPSLPSHLSIPELLTQVTGGDFDNNANDYDLLLQALIATDGQNEGFIASLGESLLTVLAPTDAAFIRLARDLGYEGSDESEAFSAIVAGLTALSEDSNPISLLKPVLLYHVIGEELSADDVLMSEAVDTLANITIAPFGFKLVDQDPGLQDPTLLIDLSDLSSENGFVHTLSRVLIPINISALLADASEEESVEAEVSDVAVDVEVNQAPGEDEVNSGDQVREAEVSQLLNSSSGGSGSPSVIGSLLLLMFLRARKKGD